MEGEEKQRNILPPLLYLLGLKKIGQEEAKSNQHGWTKFS
jgi:hypothetical protein